MDFQSVHDIPDLRGKRVLVRASLNVPVEDGVVTSDFRIRKALPTIAFLKQAGARVIVAGHIGREKEETLRPVYEAFQKHFDLEWCPRAVGGEARVAVEALQEGEVLLLENLRQHEGEKENSDAFAKALAALADVYVNDAFSVSHREHASIVGVSKLLPSYAGLTFLDEYEHLQKAMRPESPSLFILGGAKFATKLPLIDEYADIYDYMFIGGALANDLLKARGCPVGKSVVSDVVLDDASMVRDETVLLPVDVTVTDGEITRVTTPDDVKESEYIYDAGPKTIAMLREKLATTKTVLWNGPLGYYEHGFAEYTKQCAEEIARSSAHSIVGGGDTVAAIESLGLHTEFDFISTAGGAMLEFLEKKTLPGIEALKESK